MSDLDDHLDSIEETRHEVIGLSRYEHVSPEEQSVVLILAGGLDLEEGPVLVATGQVAFDQDLVTLTIRGFKGGDSSPIEITQLGDEVVLFLRS